MPVGETVGISAVAGASIGLLTLLINKCKCFYNNGDCKFGITENTITEENGVEFKVVRANGKDLIYVSKDEINDEVPIERKLSEVSSATTVYMCDLLIIFFAYTKLL